MADGDVLQHHRLAGARRCDDQGALALADRRDQVDHPRGEVLARPLGDGLEVLRLHLQPLIGIERREVVEVDPVAHRLGRLEVDRVDLEQREIPLAVLRRADLAFHGIAGAQPEAPHLGGRDVDVVRPRQVVGLGAAEEAETVGQDLQRAFAVDRLVVLGEVLEDREHHVLLAQGRRVLDLQGFGKAQQVRWGFCLEFGEMHGRLGWSDGWEIQDGNRRIPLDERGRPMAGARRSRLICCPVGLGNRGGTESAAWRREAANYAGRRIPSIGQLGKAARLFKGFASESSCPDLFRASRPCRDCP